MKKVLMTGLLLMVMVWMLGCAFRGHRCSMVGCGRTALMGSSHCRLHQGTFCVQDSPSPGEETAAFSQGNAQGRIMALAGEGQIEGRSMLTE